MSSPATHSPVKKLTSKVSVQEHEDPFGPNTRQGCHMGGRDYGWLGFGEDRLDHVVEDRLT